MSLPRPPHLPSTAPELNVTSSSHRENDRRDASQASSSQASGATLPLVEEQLEVGRSTIETGAVRLTKHVDVVDEVVDEPLIDEEVRVERRAVVPPQAVPRPPPPRHRGDTMIVPVLEERLVIEKRLFVKEELHITRVRTERRAPHHVALRKERISVERTRESPHTAPQSRSEPASRVGDLQGNHESGDEHG